MTRVRVSFDMTVERPADAAKVLEKMIAAADAGGLDDFSWTMKGQLPYFAESERNGKRVSRRKPAVAVRDDYR